MKYIGTRTAAEPISGSEAIIQGLTPDGGLYVPETFPKVSIKEIESLEDMEYHERAAGLLHKFLPEISFETLLNITRASAKRFGSGEVCPVMRLDDGLYIMELWHGPTHAFKDVALTVLPSLLNESKKLHGGGRTLILTATSGDTGKAALEGFKDAEGADVIVFYPIDGVSPMQKLQMQTAQGANVTAIGIDGNFDDAQNAVKSIFSDKEAVKKIKDAGYNLSSANSINIGRLLPQITYYFSAYSDLAAAEQIQYGDKINFCVPTGNFGNILAGYYAKKMGLPINMLVCASNKNNVLTDFMDSGEYCSAREFYKTSSPSMDILISSNLERLIFELSGRDSAKTKERMAELKDKGSYRITAPELDTLKKEFYGDSAEDGEAAEAIANFFEEYGYVADPHTAVALSAYSEYVADTGDETPAVIVSTANPHKFAASVLGALGIPAGKSESQSLKKLEDETALPVPEDLKNLNTLPLLHKRVINKNSALAAVLEYCYEKRK